MSNEPGGSTEPAAVDPTLDQGLDGNVLQSSTGEESNIPMFPVEDASKVPAGETDNGRQMSGNDGIPVKEENSEETIEARKGTNASDLKPENEKTAASANEASLQPATTTIATSDVKHEPETKVNTSDVTNAEGRVALELLLQSGSRQRYTLNGSMTMAEILASVYKDWPESWAKDRPLALSQLRLLHRGKFVKESDVLKDCVIDPLHPTVMHLTIRPPDVGTLPPPSNAKPVARKIVQQQDTHSGGCCSSCIVA